MGPKEFGGSGFTLTDSTDSSEQVQHLAAFDFIPGLPRSAIGKVLKRELRKRLSVSKSITT